MSELAKRLQASADRALVHGQDKFITVVTLDEAEAIVEALRFRDELVATVEEAVLAYTGKPLSEQGAAP